MKCHFFNVKNFCVVISYIFVILLDGMSKNAESKSPNSLTEQDFNLLSQASDEFNKKRYSNCLQTLSQFEHSAGNNVKIQRNKALAAFFLSGDKDYETYLKFLEEDIAQNDKNTGVLTDRSIAISYYNKAAILFHLRKPYAAINTLEPLVNIFEELDEPIRSKIGLLMLVLLLNTNQYERTYEALNSLGKHMSTTNDFLGSEDVFSGANIFGDIFTFNRMFKLISMLTEILNGKNVTIIDDGTVEHTFLKAHQYYLGKDFQMASKQFSRQFTSQRFSAGTHGEDQDVCLANNMGVIHLRVRHYAIAAQFFQHAIQFDNKVTENIKDLPILHISASKKPEIMYNLGIAMLHLQRPKEAFECFLVPLKIYQNNPRLWLRVAEACIMLHEKNATLNENKHIVSGVIGSGVYRKFVISPSPKLECTEGSQTSAIPNPNLEFAALCLRNAVSLAEHQKNSFFTGLDATPSESPSSDSPIQIKREICNPSPPITKESFNRLLSAIYTAYSYVCIRLGDFTIAFEYAKLLLQMGNLSDEISMLGHLYCAEALVMLNRVTDAKSYLDQNFITNLNSHDFETKDWQINSIDAAQSVLRYNLAVTLVLQGDFNSAKKILASCTHPVVFTKYKMLKMYMELAAGNLDNCKIMIKFDTPQYR